ncbi:Ran-specific GTPase-activating protein 30 [Colletotrichum chlorophyti]|uniref:Ran-specific GTPase-activating protein 30 n=1 Tax=Colletotrichum chlorophyti TaxID=708187 RepID=A0A1Q8S3I3_9PEZI|nr:Ran-specific GTPase-activating protein 30 [Colletotrichum chlorophyti]
MDALLARLGAQAMNMAIRSGIALTSTYAFSQCSRLMKTVDDRAVRSELKKLQRILECKIKIVSPVIDLIVFKSGRGNAFLESALPLAKSLHQDIVALGRRLEQAAAAAEVSRRSIDADRHLTELRAIIKDMKDLLNRINDDIGILHTAITSSGESLNPSKYPSVSPSRMMQASTFLTFGDSQYATRPSGPVQIGPVFTLSLYMLFLGHATIPAETGRGHQEPPQTLRVPQQALSAENVEPYGLREGERRPLWQEVIHKARVRLCRTPMDYVFDANEGFRPGAAAVQDLNAHESQSFWSSAYGTEQHNEYAYHLEVIEDLDDGRAHDNLHAETSPYDNIQHAGIRESIPIHQIAKIFYADTGRILNIGDDGGIDNNPVLLLKRDILAKPPKETVEAMIASGDDSMFRTPSEAGSSVDSEEEQDDIDRQLREESAALDTLEEMAKLPAGPPSKKQFPAHLDPEWIALEVFEEKYDDEDSDTDEEDAVEADPAGISDRRAMEFTPISATSSSRADSQRARTTLDSRLVAQIQSMSLQSTPPNGDMRPQPPLRHFSQDLAKHPMDNAESFVARSPFSAVTTSLSLMEMLIRLTSLQEFQQASHLTIPDHILNFFLVETSTTGLKGVEGLRARTEAKRRVGFDPYTDTPSK